MLYYVLLKYKKLINKFRFYFPLNALFLLLQYGQLKIVHNILNVKRSLKILVEENW